MEKSKNEDAFGILPLLLCAFLLGFSSLIYRSIMKGLYK